MRLSRLHISVALALAAAFWGVFLLLKGLHLGWEYLTPFGSVAGLLVVIGTGFEHFLWRIPMLHGWLVTRPDLRGTWRVLVESEYESAADGGGAQPIRGYIGVRQTLSTLQMHLMTPESESLLIASDVSSSPRASGYRVVGVYSNEPQMRLRGSRSEVHRGAFVLETHGRPARPEELTGEYWTDRKTRGRMTLTQRHRETFTRLQDAERVLGFLGETSEDG